MGDFFVDLGPLRLVLYVDNRMMKIDRANDPK